MSYSRRQLSPAYMQDFRAEFEKGDFQSRKGNNDEDAVKPMIRHFSAARVINLYFYDFDAFLLVAFTIINILRERVIVTSLENILLFQKTHRSSHQYYYQH